MTCQRYLVPVLACIALAGCPRIDNDGDTPASPLQGTWLGPYSADPASATPPPTTMQLTVDSAGRLTGVSIGGVSQNRTGTIGTTLVPRVFSIAFSDGSQALLLVDETFTYASFLMDSAGFPMAALQRGATELPAYTLADVGGTWSGTAVALDFGFNLTGFAVFEAGVACSSAGCAMAFAGPLEVFDAGVVNGRYAATDGAGLNEYLLLTPDKNFAAAAAVCGTGPISPATCIFAAWRRSPAAAEIEPDSAYGQAMPVSLPALIAGSTAGSGVSVLTDCRYEWAASPAADPDYFKFTLATAKTIMFLLNGDAGDMDLVLCSSNGVTVLGGSQQATSLEYFSQSLPPGTYLVGVLPWSNSVQTNYTLSILEF